MYEIAKFSNWLQGVDLPPDSVNCGLLRTDCTLGPVQVHHPNAGKKYVKHSVQNTDHTVPFLKKGIAQYHAAPRTQEVLLPRQIAGYAYNF